MGVKQTEALKLALKKAFDLGKRYWSWADSEYSSHWKKADAAKEQFNQLVEDTIREALAEQPAPPLECKTDAEKTAFAFGWWKALEENRKQPAQDREPAYQYLLEQNRQLTAELAKFRAVSAQALEALEYISSHYMSLPKIGCMALAAGKEALAEQPAQQQEPVAWMHPNWPNYTGLQSPVTTYMVNDWVPLYTSPQTSKTWVGLTDEQRHAYDYLGPDVYDAISKTEAKLREKNA